MSFQAMTWAVEQKVGSQSAKFLLLILANYADNAGVCWPSQERLAADTEMTDRGIRKCLAHLLEKGLIKAEERRGTGGVRKTNIYRLQLPEPRSACDPDNRNDVPPSTGTTFLSPPEPRSSKPIKDNLSEEPVRDIRPKRVRTHGSEKFEEFWKAYPTDALMSKKQAREAFERLSPDDQTSCLSAVPAFRAHCAKDATYRPLHAVRFITQRRFEGFATVSVGASEARVFMSDEEHAQWWASRRGAA